MPQPVVRSPRPRAVAPLAALPLALALGTLGAGAWAAPSAAPGATPGAVTSPAPVANSALDGQLFYQLFLGELELARGEPGVAYQVMLAAARRSRDDALFQRTVDIAIGARAGEQALAATKAWRTTLPKSRRAAEVQAQILMALARPAEATEPLRALLDLESESERNETIAALPRLVLASTGKPTAAGTLDDVLKPWRSQPGTRLAATVATARAWAFAEDHAKAMAGVREAQKIDPGSEAAAVLALDLMGKLPEAEASVASYLQQRPDGHVVRLGYARRLTSAQRYSQALKEARQVTQTDPAQAGGWLLEGALQIELQDPRAAQEALKRYLAVSEAQREAARKAADSAGDEDQGKSEGEPHGRANRSEDTAQAYLMLAQSAEQLKDYTGAQAWLDQLGELQSSPTVLTRRAMLLVRQGKVKEGRALIQTLPERNADEARSKVMAETQLLREARAWRDAYEVLEQAQPRFPDDADLLYEQALLAERLQRFDEMERLLRRVIALKPDQQHAYNALGYSLADRNLRLEEARQLIQKALELSPGDPFITDSLAWVEFRLGRREAALALLLQAYGQRPDTEIGAHLGEVLWALGQQEEARRVWRAGQDRDAANDVLKDTLSRLKVRL